MSGSASPAPQLCERMMLYWRLFRSASPDPVLRHGAEPRVDAVDDLSLLEFLQETVTRLHFAQRLVVDPYCGLFENLVVYGI